MKRLLKFLLWGQGLYYALTALWAILALENFSRITGHFGDPFEMHAIATISFVLGLAFIFGALRETYLHFAGWLLLGSTMAVILPELFYFEEIKDTLFEVDLYEEITIAVLAAVSLFKQ